MVEVTSEFVTRTEDKSFVVALEKGIYSPSSLEDVRARQ
jgi:hypothetical protein